MVAILDEDNRVTGSAPRSVMRRDNLRHAATGVVVRNAAGDIYVHRRTPIKDLYPSRVNSDPLEQAASRIAADRGNYRRRVH